MKDKSRLGKNFKSICRNHWHLFIPQSQQIDIASCAEIQKVSHEQEGKKNFILLFFSSSLLHFALTYFKIDNLEMKNETENCSSFIFHGRTFFLPYLLLSPISVLYLDICTCVSMRLEGRDFFPGKIIFLKGHEKNGSKRENCHYDNRK